jgi:hypothetical protein
MAYRGLINVDSMRDLFGDNYDIISELYADLKKYYHWDFLFWLQYGRAELEFDHFPLAENYLNQSLGIRDAADGNYQALHHKGVLMLRRAHFQSDPGVALADATAGEEILRAQIRSRGVEDSYPYVALVTHKLRYLRKRGSARYGESIEELYQVASEGFKRHPVDEAMTDAHNEVYREYLMRAVPGSRVPDPRQSVLPLAPDESGRLNELSGSGVIDPSNKIES